MSASRIALVLVGVLAFLPTAQAAGRTANAAKRACMNGDPTRGVQILTELYLATNDPTHIFNQGRCYEQNNRYEEAIGRFREYLRKLSDLPKPDPDSERSARKHIAECEALLAPSKTSESSQPLPPPPAAPPAEAVKVAPLPPDPPAQSAPEIFQQEPQKLAGSKIGLR